MLMGGELRDLETDDPEADPEDDDPQQARAWLLTGPAPRGTGG
jgi:hypothetical protein